jgi:pSer/pThr/pTyr-binding forkhead associated (FHA) protein/Flp pilus assembly protein TadD
VFKLIIEDDEGHTTVVPLVKEEITIGRKEGNTIRLTERNVSRHHARLIRSNGTVFIEDLDSYNGVKVNGGKISARTTIREGDLVEIGDYHLALQRAEEPPAPPQDSSKTQPPPVRTASAAPAPTTADGGTAVLRLPIEDKHAPEPGRARPIVDEQAGRLVILSTDLVGQVFVLNKTEMTIGRTEENDITLPHRSVSSRHAKLVCDGGVYRVIDLDSANGVLVNGEEYARVDVRKGDVIELGHVKLRFVTPDEDVNTLLVQASAGAAEQAVDSDLLSTAPTPAPAPAPMRSLVDASQAEAQLAKSGAGKKIGLVLGALILLGGAGYAVFHFTQSGTDADPGKDQAVVVQPEQPGAGTEPGVPPEDGTQPGSTAKAEAADYFRQGLEQMKAGDYGLAEQALQSAIKLDPEHKGAQEMLERVVREKEAATLLTQAQAAIDKKDWDEALDLLNQVPEAAQSAKEAAGIRPEVVKKYRGFHLNKADKFEKANKLQDALKEYDAVLMVDEENYLAKSRKERLLKRLSSPKKQPRVAQTTKRPEPDDSAPKEPPAATGNKAKQADELRQKGIEAYKQQQFSKAISHFQNALKLNPRDNELYRLLGSTYARLGNRKMAYQAYRKYVQVCPKCPYTPSIRKILKEYEDHQQ